MHGLRTIRQRLSSVYVPEPKPVRLLGVPQRLDELPDPSEAAQIRQLQDAEQLLRQMDSIDVSTLDPDQKIDISLAKLALERVVFESNLRFNGCPHWAICPRAGDDISDGIFFLFINDPRAPGTRLENIIHRIEGIPRYIDELLARLDKPIARWVSIDIEKVEGLHDFFNTLAEWAATIDDGLHKRFCSAQCSAEGALNRYCDALKQMEVSHDFSIGHDAAAKYVQLRGVNLSLEELHTIATQYLAENIATIQTLTAKLKQKYTLPIDATPADVQAFLNEKFRVVLPNDSLDDILSRYQEERERILAYIKQHELFPVFDAQDMKIMKTPAFMAPSIPAGAMFSPHHFGRRQDEFGTPHSVTRVNG